MIIEGQSSGVHPIVTDFVVLPKRGHHLDKEGCKEFKPFYGTMLLSKNKTFLLQNVVHELRITNQVIYLNPPIEECRYKLYQEMFAWKMIVLSLPRIQSQRYQVSFRGL